MITQDQVQHIVGATAYDRDGDKIGKIGQIYFDDDTDQAKWVTVNTGLFGTSENFVPVQDAEIGGDRVTVAFDKAKVKGAPKISEDGHLSPEEEEQLYRYYGLSWGGAEYGRDRNGDGVRDGGRDTAVGHDTSGPTTDHAMTRSEEQLKVGTETREAGRARLRKRVVTEQQQVSVPVAREEVRIEREPITEGNRGDALDGPAISEEEHEVVLREERPVVNVEAVPVERVRLGTETVQETETVGGEVRKEQIELDGDDATGTVRGRTNRN